MKISEFAKTVQESLEEFFGEKVTSEIYFEHFGKFLVRGSLLLNRDKKWDTIFHGDPVITLFEALIEISDLPDHKPLVKYIVFNYSDGSNKGIDGLCFSLEEAITYIKENLETPKSKAIYDNL